MALGRKLHSIKGYDIGRAGADYAGNELESVSWTDTRPRIKYFNDRLIEIQAMLDKMFGAGNARIASTDRPRENILVAVGSPAQRGTY